MTWHPWIVEKKQQLHASQSFVVQHENLNSMKRSSLNTPELYNRLSFICQSAHEMSCHRHLTISRDQLQCLRGDKKSALVGGLFRVWTTERKRSFHAVHEGCNSCTHDQKCCRWRFIQMFSTQNIETWKVSLSRYSHKMSQTLRERRYVSRKSRICFGGVHQIHLGMCQVDQPLPSGPSVYLFGGGLMLVATGHLQQKICRNLWYIGMTTSKEAQFQHWKPS